MQQPYMQQPFGPRQPDPRQGHQGQWPSAGGPPAPGGAYVPGNARPPVARPLRRSVGGRTLGRLPATRMARTDPTLYQWDRLSPEQQQAVLATIRAAGIRRGQRLSIPGRKALLVLLAAAMILLFVLYLTH